MALGKRNVEIEDLNPTECMEICEFFIISLMSQLLKLCHVVASHA